MTDATCHQAGRIIGPAAALLAAAAITTSAGCERADRPPPESQAVTTQVSLFNATHDVLPLSVRSIQSDYTIDCDLVAAEPDRYLSDVHLTNRYPLSEQFDFDILSGLEVPIRVDRNPAEFNEDCHLAFVDLDTDDDRLEPVAISWPRNLDEKTVYYDVHAPADTPPDDHTLVADVDLEGVDDETLDERPWRHRPCGGDLDDCSESEYATLLEPLAGADYSWSVDGDIPRESSWEPREYDERPYADPDDECRTGRDATPLRWDNPPSGTWRVESIAEVIVELEDPQADAEDDDGEPTIEWRCQDVELTSGDQQEPQVWQFCGSNLLPMRIASEAFDGDVYIDFFTEQQDGSPPSVYEALTIDLERRTDDGERWETETIEAVRGHGVPEHLGLDWAGEAATACEPRRELADACHQIVVPADLRVEATGGPIRIEPGELRALDPVADRRLEHIRGLYRAVSDRRCNDQRLGPDHMSHSGPYFEFVYFPGASRVDDG